MEPGVPFAASGSAFRANAPFMVTQARRRLVPAAGFGKWDLGRSQKKRAGRSPPSFRCLYRALLRASLIPGRRLRPKLQHLLLTVNLSDCLRAICFFLHFQGVRLRKHRWFGDGGWGGRDGFAIQLKLRVHCGSGSGPFNFVLSRRERHPGDGYGLVNLSIYGVLGGMIKLSGRRRAKTLVSTNVRANFMRVRSLAIFEDADYDLLRIG
jgi:hypothetical protein